MAEAGVPIVLWRLRNPSDGQTVHCSVAEHQGRFLLAVSEPPTAAVAFDGRVAAIHHAARLATELRAKGWVDA